jgi:hypothetical protein
MEKLTKVVAWPGQATQQNIIKLTNELYQLTRLFPKKEPLRYKIRGAADEVLAGFLKPEPDVKHSLEILQSFLAVANEQNWVKPSFLLNLIEKYASLRQELETDFVESQPAIDFNGVKKSIRRQDKVLEILKEKGRAQVWEFKKVLPSVSKRTLRRDLEYLLSQGSVERIGDKSQTFYVLKQPVAG